MNSFSDRRLLLGITGGIAAYKSPEIVRLLIKAGGEVRVVMTRAAANFVTRATLETVSGNRVHTDLFPPEGSVEPLHIELARWPDAALVAPATANIIGKAALGIADEILSVVLMATEAPIFMAPSMNPAMYHHPAVQKNLETLSSRGVRLLEPEFGPLASKGEGSGLGRMPEPAKIVEWLERGLRMAPCDLEGRRALITAGPTLEEIDPVRFISNHSSGKMGYSLAEECALRGAEVVLIHGPVNLPAPPGVKAVEVRTSEEMMNAVAAEYPRCDFAVMCAAVADYKPAQRSERKIKKDDSLTLELVKNPDILEWMGANRESRFLVGFALEDSGDLNEARRKLSAKNLDLIILNYPSALHSDDTEITLVDRDGEEKLPSMSKKAAAVKVVDCIAAGMG